MSNISLNLEVVKCAVCSKEYFRKIKGIGHKGKRKGNIRQHNSKTCCRFCANEYTRGIQKKIKRGTYEKTNK